MSMPHSECACERVHHVNTTCPAGAARRTNQSRRLGADRAGERAPRRPAEMKTSCEIVHYSAVLGGDTAPYPARFLMALKKSSNSGKERSPESSVSYAKQKASSTVSTTRASSASHAVTNQHGERIKLHALVQRRLWRGRLNLSNHHHRGAVLQQSCGVRCARHVTTTATHRA